MLAMALYETQDSFEYGRSFDTVRGDLKTLRRYAENHIGKHCYAGVVKNGEEYITFIRGSKGLEVVYLKVAPEVISNLLETSLDFCNRLKGKSKGSISSFIISERKGYLAEISMKIFNEGVPRYLLKNDCSIVSLGGGTHPRDAENVNKDDIARLFDSISKVSDKLTWIKYDSKAYYRLYLKYEDFSQKGYLYQNGLLKYYKEGE